MANLFDRLKDSGLIVRHHDGNQFRLWLKRAAHVRGIDQTAAVHRKNRDFAADFFQMLAGMKYGMMLNARSDHVIARGHQSGDREIVALRAAAGEDNLRGHATQQVSHRFACVLNRGARFLPVVVDRRGVAEVLPKIGAHGFEDLG